MKRMAILLVISALCLSLAGCGLGHGQVGSPASSQPGTSAAAETAGVQAAETAAPETEPPKSVPFQDGQLYAVAYLGYGSIDDLDYYMENYLNVTSLPIHYISGGEYYLIIPRGDEMTVKLYVIDPETSTQTLIYEEAECRPFIVQCNASDIFADLAVEISGPEGSAGFSPSLSLRDGSVQAGDSALDLTKQG